MTKPEVIKLLAMLSVAYPNMKEVNEQTVKLWYQSLKDIRTEDALIAAEKHIMESPYPPTIADIRGIKTAKKTGFHNFKQRTDKYTEAQLEEICRKKREERLSMLQDNKEMLSLEDKSKEG